MCSTEERHLDATVTSETVHGERKDPEPKERKMLLYDSCFEVPSGGLEFKEPLGYHFLKGTLDEDKRLFTPRSQGTI